MGLLEDLQEKAGAIRAEEERLDAKFQADEEFYRDHLRPVMQRINAYFSEIVDKLNIVTPDIRAFYPLDPSRPQGIPLKQSTYRYRSDSSKNPHQLDILCSCSLEKPSEFYVSTKISALQHADLLEDYDFPHHRKNKLDKFYDACGATFILEGPMKVHIRILASAADRCIYVILRNFGKTPKSKPIKLAPEAIDDELMERLAMILIRNETKLVDVKVDSAVRDKLQRQLEIEKQRDEKNMAAIYADIEIEKKAQEDAKLINRTKRAILARTGEAMKIIRKT